MMAGFNYTYKPLSQADAQKQVAAQLDPLFNRAVQNVNQAKYANDVQAGQVAAARGLGHSGLAADQLNKIAIAAQGQIGDLNAQRATQLAQQANDLVWRDKEYALQDRSQKYSEFSDNRNYNYQVGRDKVTDKQWKTQFDYTKSIDTRDFNYQKSRDKVEDQWRQKEWIQMSPAEKARMALEYSYNKRLKASSGGRGGSSGNRRRSSSSSSRSSGSNKNTSIKKPSGSYNTAFDQYAQRQRNIYMPGPRVKPIIDPPKVANDNTLSPWQKIKIIGF